MKKSILNNKEKTSVCYSFIKFSSKEAEDAITLTSYDLIYNIDSKKEEIKKDNLWLQTKVVLNYNYFKNSSEESILKLLINKNIKTFVYEICKTKNETIILREVKIPDK
jgi:hypothetical protein